MTDLELRALYHTLNLEPGTSLAQLKAMYLHMKTLYSSDSPLFHCLGFPIPEITQLSPGASRPLKAPKELADYAVEGLEKALAVKSTQVRVFGKPVTKVGRRMAVALSAAETVEEARERAAEALSHLSIT